MGLRYYKYGYFARRGADSKRNDDLSVYNDERISEINSLRKYIYENEEKIGSYRLDERGVMSDKFAIVGDDQRYNLEHMEKIGRDRDEKFGIVVCEYQKELFSKELWSEYSINQNYLRFLRRIACGDIQIISVRHDSFPLSDGVLKQKGYGIKKYIAGNAGSIWIECQTFLERRGIEF